MSKSPFFKTLQYENLMDDFAEYSPFLRGAAKADQCSVYSTIVHSNFKWQGGYVSNMSKFFSNEDENLKPYC